MLYVNYTSIKLGKKIETAQLSVKCKIDKQNEVYPYNGVLFSCKMNAVQTCYNMNEPWKLYGKLKKPVTKGISSNYMILFI